MCAGFDEVLLEEELWGLNIFTCPLQGYTVRVRRWDNEHWSVTRSLSFRTPGVPERPIVEVLALHPTSYTLHPTPYTLHFTSYTLHPTPYTLHPMPHSLHPTPYTLHREPYTQYPTP